jgi:gliding motility-associated-like protein
MAMYNSTSLLKLALLLFSFIPSMLSAQCGIETNITLQPNSSCLECNYVGPSILINEICIAPTSGDGSIFGPGATGAGSGEGEWIELYNPNWCDSIDISGYLLGSFNSTGSPTLPASNGMAFTLPQGTVVPPLGFVVVRGQNTPPPPPDAIDIIVNNNNNQICIDGGIGVSRLWFQNTGGWFAFYDADGVPQDVISWGNPPLGDLNGNPCTPPTNSLPPGFGTIPSYTQSGIGVNVGNFFLGQNFVRIPDGGPWSPTLAPENFSYGSCNDPNNCLSQTGITVCNGTATVNVTAGTGPFTYLWNDPASQTNATALNLCADDYDVIVTDANGCSQTFSITIVDDIFEIEAIGQDPSCSNDDGEISVTVDSPGNYSFVWSSNTGITDTITTNATGLSDGIYTIEVSGGGCTKDTTIQLVAPPPITDLLLTSNTTTCGNNNGSILIEEVIGGTPNFTFNLSDGTSATNNNTFPNLSPGTYEVIVTDENDCTFEVGNIVVAPSQGIAGVNTLISPENCGENDGFIVVVGIDGGNPPFDITLNGALIDDSAFFDLTAGSYIINISDADDCVFAQNLNVPLEGQTILENIPNIFTPNGDGVNDFWFIETDCVERFECIIVNRWGNPVFETNNYLEQWDGRDQNNNPLTDGVYFYKVNMRFFGATEDRDFHGFIHLKR